MFYRLLAALVVVAALVPAGCDSKKSSPAGAGQLTSNRKKYSRDEFETMVKGKTMQEVIAAVGNPDYQMNTAGKEEWAYAGITNNPANNQADIKTTLFFKGGRVDRIAYGID